MAEFRLVNGKQKFMYLPVTPSTALGKGSLVRPIFWAKISAWVPLPELGGPKTKIAFLFSIVLIIPIPIQTANRI